MPRVTYDFDIHIIKRRSIAAIQADLWEIDYESKHLWWNEKLCAYWESDYELVSSFIPEYDQLVEKVRPERAHLTITIEWNDESRTVTLEDLE